MLVQSSMFVLIASLISGLLCCSEQGAAQHIKATRYEGMPSRRADHASEFFYNRGAYRQPSEVPRHYHQDPEQYEHDRFKSQVEAIEENYEYSNDDEQQEEEEEVQDTPKFARAEKESSGMQTAASYAQPVKSERTASRFSGSTYKSGYGSGYSITLQPGAIAITCTVKDPLEHIVWLRTLCPDEYDRGDVIARGAVSSFPDVFSVSVSGEDGQFTSTLSIDKPRSQMGSGVFRCEAWPHHSSEHHRRHRRQAEDRKGRGHHDPWNAIIVGGSEMVDECFYNHYGDRRQYRGMDGQGRMGGKSGNSISAEGPIAKHDDSHQLNETHAAYSSNLFPGLAQTTDYDELLKLLQENGASSLADLATADLTQVPQVDNRNQRHSYPQANQRQYPVYTPTPNMGKPQEAQPMMHYQSRRVNVQSGGKDVRADIEMSTDLQVHPHRESHPNRMAYSRMIQVQGEPQKQQE